MRDVFDEAEWVLDRSLVGSGRNVLLLSSEGSENEVLSSSGIAGECCWDAGVSPAIVWALLLAAARMVSSRLSIPALAPRPSLIDVSQVILNGSGEMSMWWCLRRQTSEQKRNDVAGAERRSFDLVNYAGWAAFSHLEFLISYSTYSLSTTTRTFSSGSIFFFLICMPFSFMTHTQVPSVLLFRCQAYIILGVGLRIKPR